MARPKTPVEAAIGRHRFDDRFNIKRKDAVRPHWYSRG